MSGFIELGALGLVSLLVVSVVQGEGNASLPDRVLYTFEEGKPLELRTHRTQVRLERRRAPQGKQALYVEFLEGEWPNIAFYAGNPPWDWRGYTGLCLTVRNPGKENMQFGVRVDDDPRADGAQFCRQGWGMIEAGKTRTFVLPLASYDPMSIGMRGLPNPRPDVSSVSLTTINPLRLEHIVSLMIFMHRPQPGTPLIIDDIRLVAWLPDPKTLRDLVDEFGQYTGADWRGKLKSAREFAQRIRAEQRDLQAHPPSPDFDKYGGWLKGPRLQATGYFRTEKVKGKWWLVTPNGTPFLSIGMDCANLGEATMITGREHLFRWLPKDDEPLAHHRWFASGVIRGPVKEGMVYNFYSANLRRKYGDHFRERWAEVTLQRLRSWGFNTIGAWSEWELLRAGKIPYTVILHIGGEHARVSSGIDFWGKMHDPFDPRFEQSVRQAIEAVAKRVGDDPYCIGYFIDNELSWTGGYEEGGLYGLAFGALSEDAEQSPAKRALIEQLRTKYGTISALNSAWNTAYPDWETLAKPQRITATSTPEQRKDLRIFVLQLAERYFSTVRRVLKEYAPNHLYLGARFAWVHPAVLQVASNYCDVLSFNIYSKSVAGWWEPTLSQVDKPAIGGEFHFGSLDSGMFHPGLVPATSQRHRAEMYRNYLYSVADHPQFVGCHWFQYIDQPTTGRWFDGENYNIGFVSITDTPYPELVAMARKVNREVYARRYGL